MNRQREFLLLLLIPILHHLIKMRGTNKRNIRSGSLHCWAGNHRRTDAFTFTHFTNLDGSISYPIDVSYKGTLTASGYNT